MILLWCYISLFFFIAILYFFFFFFFFNDTATTEIYTFPTRRSSDLCLLGWLSRPVGRKFWFAVGQCRPFVHERWLALAVWRRRTGLGLPRRPPGFQRPLRPDHRLHDRLSRHLGRVSGTLRCFNGLLFRRRLRFFLEVALQLPREPGESRHPQPHDQRSGSVHPARFEQDEERQKNHHQKSVKIFFEQPLRFRRRNPQQPHPLDGLLGIVRLGTLWRHGLRAHASPSSSSGPHQNNKEFPGSRPLRIPRCPLVCQLPGSRCCFLAAAHKPHLSSPPQWPLTASSAFACTPATKSWACSESGSFLDCSPSPARQSLPHQSAPAPAHIFAIPDENRTPAAASQRSSIFPAHEYRSCSPARGDRSSLPQAPPPVAPHRSGTVAPHAIAAPSRISFPPREFVSIAPA